MSSIILLECLLSYHILGIHRSWNVACANDGGCLPTTLKTNFCAIPHSISFSYIQSQIISHTARRSLSTLVVIVDRLSLRLCIYVSDNHSYTVLIRTGTDTQIHTLKKERGSPSGQDRNAGMTMTWNDSAIHDHIWILSIPSWKPLNRFLIPMVHLQIRYVIIECKTQQ